MSDTILNKLNVKNKQNGIVFSKKELVKENNEVQSELDKRINDLLHKIEFTNATQKEAYKLYMKLQGFLRKKTSNKINSW